MSSSGSSRSSHGDGRVTLGVRTGGRSARIRQAVLSATVDELLERGPEDLSIARIAASADVARSTIVRRWPTREALLADAVGDVAERARAGFQVPDLGSTRAELAYLAEALAAALTDARVRESLRVMLAMPGEAMERARAEHAAERERVLREVVERGIARGELDTSTDPLHLGDLLTSPIWMQTFMNDGLADGDLIERVVSDALRRFAGGAG